MKLLFVENCYGICLGVSETVYKSRSCYFMLSTLDLSLMSSLLSFELFSTHLVVQRGLVVHTGLEFTDPPASVSWVARITGMYHHTRPIMVPLIWFLLPGLLSLRHVLFNGTVRCPWFNNYLFNNVAEMPPILFLKSNNYHQMLLSHFVVWLICYHRPTGRPQMRLRKSGERPAKLSQCLIWMENNLLWHTWELLTIWFSRLGLFSNITTGFYNDIRSLM